MSELAYCMPTEVRTWQIDFTKELCRSYTRNRVILAYHPANDCTVPWRDPHRTHHPLCAATFCTIPLFSRARTHRTAYNTPYRISLPSTTRKVILMPATTQPTLIPQSILPVPCPAHTTRSKRLRAEGPRRTSPCSSSTAASGYAARQVSRRLALAVLSYVASTLHGGRGTWDLRYHRHRCRRGDRAQASAFARADGVSGHNA